MTRSQLKMERKAVKAKKAVNRITHNFDAERSLDILAFVVLVAIVMLAFLLDGILETIPEDLTVLYLLMSMYLAFYVIHKLIIMKENEH